MFANRSGNICKALHWHFQNALKIKKLYVLQIGTVQGKYQTDGILGYIGDDYVQEPLRGHTTHSFSVPQNGDFTADAPGLFVSQTEGTLTYIFLKVIIMLYLVSGN